MPTITKRDLFCVCGIQFGDTWDDVVAVLGDPADDSDERNEKSIASFAEGGITVYFDEYPRKVNRIIAFGRGQQEDTLSFLNKRDIHDPLSQTLGWSRSSLKQAFGPSLCEDKYGLTYEATLRDGALGQDGKAEAHFLESNGRIISYRVTWSGNLRKIHPGRGLLPRRKFDYHLHGLPTPQEESKPWAAEPMRQKPWWKFW